jgi:XrtN system VIT domain protein
MKSLKKIIFDDRLVSLGLVLIAFSAAIFFLTDEQTDITQTSGFGVFFFNYAITVIYSLTIFIATFSVNRWRLQARKIEYTVLLLLLWFISAFSLNREMNVFDMAVGWLCVLINASCLVLILAVFRRSLPPFLKHLVFFMMGSAFLLFLYYSVYLTPLYIVSMIAAIGLGIALHSYVPLALAIVTGILAYKTIQENKALAYSFFSGLFISVLFCAWFIIQWSSINTDINRALNHNTLSEGQLPSWTVISQNIPKNYISERIIKTDLVYKIVDTENSFWWGSFNSSSFDEPKKHDPLVVLSSLFCGKPNLSEKERIKILESMYDSRHQAAERLWLGNKLQTASVVSNVKLFPEYRLAYTEKILSIKNSENRLWNQNQEAIYTFHLPEGSVVTSLSLWIEGQEEKAYLTTTAKADSAYKQIVGVEIKDPSVTHWQEGNTVSVRVFPCNADENRKFKIGISSPFRKEGDRLIYENIYFDGPSGMKATETAQLTFSEKPAGFQIPNGFAETTDGVYQLDRGYKPYWEISCKTPKLSSQTFSFSNFFYRMKEYKVQYEHFDPESIYLDLNSSWSETELMSIWESIRLKQVYAFDGKRRKLSDENIRQVYKRAVKQNFSLFPIYEIPDAGKALIITKSTDSSPNLDDLKGSEFQKNLTAYLKEPKSIRLYNIGHQLSPYLKALKEFRVFSYHDGTVADLQKLLNNKQFIVHQENANNVVIDHAGLMIEQIKGTTNGKAPDHLLRLFAYNDIMKKVGAHYFSDNYIQPGIIEEAEKAYVVSPVSSLIVLETREDYERFDIQASKSSLKNASMKSSGAVPEPHEWMLILLTGAVVIYLIYKPKFSKRGF